MHKREAGKVVKEKKTYVPHQADEYSIKKIAGGRKGVEKPN